jgi:hypothetical protein
MVLVKATEATEANVMPSTEEMAEMGQFNEEMVKAGVMLAGEGLAASHKGARIYYDGDKRTVVDGPFAEAKELIAGFWIWQVKSMDEALEWARRAPFREGQLELRTVFEAEDFGEAYTPELREQEEWMREEVARQTSGQTSGQQ